MCRGRCQMVRWHGCTVGWLVGHDGPGGCVKLGFGAAPEFFKLFGP
jgi:hypothetical protein